MSVTVFTSSFFGSRKWTFPDWKKSLTLKFPILAPHHAPFPNWPGPFPELQKNHWYVYLQSPYLNQSLKNNWKTDIWRKWWMNVKDTLMLMYNVTTLQYFIPTQRHITYHNNQFIHSTMFTYSTKIETILWN